MEMEIRRAPVNQNTGFLKLIAVLTMIVDHAGVVLFPGALWMRVVGRMAFPLFAWSIAIGAKKTRDIRRYALRLLITGVAAQPFYMFVLHHELTKLNIFAVLLLGLIGCWGIRDRKYHLTVIALLLAVFLDMDYGVKGVLLILLLYVLQEDPLWLAVCFSAYCVFWGRNNMAVFQVGSAALRLQTCAILSLPLMLYPSKGRWNLPKWVWYAAYPGHLALLEIAARLM